MGSYLVEIGALVFVRDVVELFCVRAVCLLFCKQIFRCVYLELVFSV